MGYLLSKDGFDRILAELSRYYRLYGPVRKQGEGRFTDTDVIRYDLLKSSEDLELEHKSDYSFKETLLPLSETLFYFTEEQAKEADHTERGTIVFLRSCDLHAVKRLDQMY
ncbi:MAG: anaerobic sulfite reductase subunit A, partial [Lachnospiraceae bacterium]|nr:anaerobic sulfite reductase subunit A [Lachnospiraceae bacterium]